MASGIGTDCDYSDYSRSRPSYARHALHDESEASARDHYSGRGPTNAGVASGATAATVATAPALASSLLGDMRLPGRANAPLRQAVLLSMQRTHGNRAVQRAIQRTPAPDEEVKKQGGNTEDPASTANNTNNVSTAASSTFGGVQLGTRAALEASQAKRSSDMLKSLSKDPALATSTYDEAHAAAESSKQTRLLSLLERGPSSENKAVRAALNATQKATSSNNYAGMTLGLLNYPLKLWQNMAQGQGLGEAAFGAVTGGFVNNFMPGYLFNAPKPTFGIQPRTTGAVDAAINVVNAGLNLIPGMPEEVTTVTQTVADATPSSFGTSLASNAGRGLWNTGKGIFTGDWSGLKQQGEDITHGRAGAPLQGYGLVKELFSSRERYGEITDEMRQGKWGQVPKLSLKLKDWVTDDAAPWVKDKVGGASGGVKDFFGHSLIQGAVKTQARKMNGLQLLETKREQIEKHYGKNYYDILRNSVEMGAALPSDIEAMGQGK